MWFIVVCTPTDNKYVSLLVFQTFFRIVNKREKFPSLVQSIWALPIVVYASEITVIFFLGNTNQSILFLDILVIVCVNLTSTSKAVIFKRLSKGLQIFTSPNRFLQ